MPLLSKELAEMAQLRRTYLARVGFAFLLFSTSALLFLPTYQALSKLPRGVFGHGAEFFDVLYAIEWAGLVLFVPAVVSGALTAEKERNTLQLLFLTKLGPWTILLEKLLCARAGGDVSLGLAAPAVYRLFVGRTDARRRRVGDRGAGVDGVRARVDRTFLFGVLRDVGLGVHPVVRDHGPRLPVPFLVLLSLFLFNWWSRLVGAGDINCVPVGECPQYRDTVRRS